MSPSLNASHHQRKTIVAYFHLLNAIASKLVKTATAFSRMQSLHTSRPGTVSPFWYTWRRTVTPPQVHGEPCAHEIIKYVCKSTSTQPYILPPKIHSTLYRGHRYRRHNGITVLSPSPHHPLSPPSHSSPSVRYSLTFDSLCVNHHDGIISCGRLLAPNISFGIFVFFNVLLYCILYTIR